jgi:TonB family protein
MNFVRGFFVSILIHTAVLAACLVFIHLHGVNAGTVDIDLKDSSLLLRPKNAIRSGASAAEDWWLMSSYTRAVPARLTYTAHEAGRKETNVCPPPCLDNAADWGSAASSAQRPVWISGMITESDYPQDAKKQGVQGEVRVELFIDAAGRVRGERILRSTDPRFSKVVLEHLKESTFQPALDGNGNPIAVRMTMPVIFRVH